MTNKLSFKILHLRHRELIHLERLLRNGRIDEPLKAQAKQVISAYISLVSNQRLRDGENFTTVWNDKVKNIQFLIENKWFVHVANIITTNALDAIKKTTSLNEHWFLKPKIDLVCVPWRSSETGDIVEFNDTQYLYMTGGFLNLKTLTFDSRKK